MYYTDCNREIRQFGKLLYVLSRKFRFLAERENRLFSFLVLFLAHQYRVQYRHQARLRTFLAPTCLDYFLLASMRPW
jgi:hypothetical protein